MGERSQKVVINDGEVFAFTDRRGAHSCFRNLMNGPEVVLGELASSEGHSERIVWYDACFVEGGYLVDFDDKHILLHSCDTRALNDEIAKIRQK